MYACMEVVIITSMAKEKTILDCEFVMITSMSKLDCDNN